MEIFELAIKTLVLLSRYVHAVLVVLIIKFLVRFSPERRLQLSMHWILVAARGKKGEAMFKKLGDELILASNNEGSAVKKREDTHKMAEANKALLTLLGNYQNYKHVTFCDKLITLCSNTCVLFY